jgi:hypothetical protein
MENINYVKDKLLFITKRHHEILKEPYLPYTGSSGFICTKNQDWYKYRGGPDKLGNPNIMVHILFTQIIYHDKDEVFNLIYNILKSDSYDSSFIKIYQSYKKSLYEVTMFLEQLDLEIDSYTDLITYEQIINMIDYSFAHLSLLKIDLAFLYLTEVHKKQYLQTFNFFEMLQFRKAPLVQIMSMGLLYAEYPINFKEKTEFYLSDEGILKYKSFL